MVKSSNLLLLAADVFRYMDITKKKAEPVMTPPFLRKLFFDEFILAPRHFFRNPFPQIPAQRVFLLQLCHYQ